MIKLLTTKELAYSSASAIEVYQNKLYVFGDDAPYLLILSTDYQVIDSIRYWEGNVDRISKSEKPDIESATFVEKDNRLVLLGLGSMSDEKRWDVLKLAIDSNVISRSNLFKPGTTFPNVREINIEGSCTVGNTLVLSNRANLKNTTNQLLFWQQKGLPITKEIHLPKTEIIAGISGLYYLKEKDLLFFTASEEATESAIADGEIGESYLGYIESFSNKMNAPSFKPDQFIKLNEVDNAFTKQKIESVCIEGFAKEGYTLHLVADNDNGTSKLFKAILKL